MPESNGRPLLCRQMRKPTFANRAQALAWVEGLEPPFSVLETDRFAAILHPCEFWLGEMDSNHYPFVQSKASCRLDDLRIIGSVPRIRTSIMCFKGTRPTRLDEDGTCASFNCQRAIKKPPL